MDESILGLLEPTERCKKLNPSKKNFGEQSKPFCR
jgi:hypothetical protein